MKMTTMYDLGGLGQEKIADRVTRLNKECCFIA